MYIWHAFDIDKNIVHENFLVQKICEQNYGIQCFSPGIVIVYDGQSYQNNSIVNLDAEGGILQCFTNKSGCCNVRPNREGEWRYPNGSLVQIRGRSGDLYRTRGNNPGVVNLHWTKNALIPTGLLCCEISPYIYYYHQKACIGVYPPDKGNSILSQSN